MYVCRKVTIGLLIKNERGNKGVIIFGKAVF